MSAPATGLMAGFQTHTELLAAAKHARAAGYRALDAYSPFPVEGLAQALGHGGSIIPFLVLLAGISGGAGGYYMQWYANVQAYPLNIGGRPLHSWPAFIPITFELTILCAALTALISMLLLNRLPRLNHPVFNVPEFARASTDRFFLCIESSDPLFDVKQTRAFLESQQPYMIAEVMP